MDDYFASPEYRETNAPYRALMAAEKLVALCHFHPLDKRKVCRIIRKLASIAQKEIGAIDSMPIWSSSMMNFIERF